MWCVGVAWGCGLGLGMAGSRGCGYSPRPGLGAGQVRRHGV